LKLFPAAKLSSFIESSTMSSSEGTSEQLEARLADLTTRAAAKDAVKDHNAAAELYSQATEIQAELNGEMSVENAGLLYAYGKSLYNVAVGKSDVLGSKIAGEPTSSETAKPTGSASASEGLIKAAVSSSASKGNLSEDQSQGPSQKNQFFQFTGDENFEDSNSEDGDSNKAEEEEDDDFANAFEVLDLARILLGKKLEQMETDSADKGKVTEIPPAVRHIKERLADIYDLQAEISLEGERFHDAVTDLRAALELKEALLPLEDPSLAECHYKLSLALEFSSVTREQDGDEPSQDDKPAVMDVPLRDEAVQHMETAIESCKIRMAQEEQKLKNGEIQDEDKVNATRRKITNVKEIVADMEQRVSVRMIVESTLYFTFADSLIIKLLDLRRPPVSVNDPGQATDNLDALNGILGQIIGKSSTEQKARLDEVAKGANDLSSLVRRKAPSNSSGSKRPNESFEQEENAKRAKTEDLS
jgi:HAT1-interacting factor 1